ncbi:hypothetical protein [uncultured Roseobacter sp.]|uniref:hypothetical protein n=1 Tax=uncultured Roseobacter sp. TaxID=114847 RepID=UPI002607EE39|nr:hypothetical protein [uncultured Roseobacter sp.]
MWFNPAAPVFRCSNTPKSNFHITKKDTVTVLDASRAAQFGKNWRRRLECKTVCGITSPIAAKANRAASFAFNGNTRTCRHLPGIQKLNALGFESESDKLSSGSLTFPFVQFVQGVPV